MARRRYQNGSVRKKGKAWELRWREDVGDQRVLRSQVFASLKQYPTKRLALRDPFVVKKLGDLNSMTVAYTPRRSELMLFSVFADRYEKTVVVNYKPSTQPGIRQHLKNYLLPYFKDCWLSDIDSMLIQQFISTFNDKPLSPTYVIQIVATLKMMWNVAKTWNLVNRDSDPFEGVRLPRRTPFEPRFFTLDEMRSIILEAEEPLKTFFWLAAETGMRAGELCGLRKTDVDFENCVVWVRQSVWKGQHQMPKSRNSIRRFSISPELCLQLRGLVSAPRKIDSGLLFQTRKGTAWRRDWVVQNRLQPLLDKLGIKRAGLHAFRHGNASLMDRFSVPMKVRQGRLGHVDPAMTMRYTHMISADETKFVGQLGTEFCGQSA